MRGGADALAMEAWDRKNLVIRAGCIDGIKQRTGEHHNGDWSPSRISGNDTGAIRIHGEEITERAAEQAWRLADEGSPRAHGWADAGWVASSRRLAIGSNLQTLRKSLVADPERGGSAGD
jgi:hypothetical protein